MGDSLLLFLFFFFFFFFFSMPPGSASVYSGPSRAAPTSGDAASNVAGAALVLIKGHARKEEEKETH